MYALFKCGSICSTCPSKLFDLQVGRSNILHFHTALLPLVLGWTIGCHIYVSENKGIEDGGSTADIRMLWSATELRNVTNMTNIFV